MSAAGIRRRRENAARDERERRVSALFNLYGALGWAVPSGIESASLGLLDVSIGMARDALAARR